MRVPALLESLPEQGEQSVKQAEEKWQLGRNANGPWAGIKFCAAIHPS
jgi:hypothetical protein